MYVFILWEERARLIYLINYSSFVEVEEENDDDDDDDTWSLLL